jgi:hypothetical protein
MGALLKHAERRSRIDALARKLFVAYAQARVSDEAMRRKEAAFLSQTCLLEAEIFEAESEAFVDDEHSAIKERARCIAVVEQLLRTAEKSADEADWSGSVMSDAAAIDAFKAVLAALRAGDP